jgi:hypothetical protein
LFDAAGVDSLAGVHSATCKLDVELP